MFEVIYNPKGIESTYIAYLNVCFPTWGDQTTYKWCFDRQVGDMKADRIIIKKNGKIISGSGITYRKVLFSGSVINVGIMTGSWTLPDAFRCGCSIP